MKSYYNIHIVWVAMIFLTLSTYVMGKLGFTGLFITFFLLFTTAIKGVLIIRDYMELEGVSLLWRVIMYGWLWVVILTIAVTYAMTLY